jgi:Pentapeptide repeats (8 copies)
VAALPGLAAVGALIFTALTLRATEQGQITDRYTKAIAQLGNADRDIRLGGVYALERLRRDSPPDQPTIMDVLADFAREHAQDPPPDTYKPLPLFKGTPLDIDVGAALTVLGRRNRAHDQRFTFNLAGADFHGKNLSRLNLSRADLFGADLSGADLTGAWLIDANLTRANLESANLTRGLLDRATLTGTHLESANLSGVRGMTRAQITSQAHTDKFTTF